MSKEVLLNDFAIRSFREVADYDYIAARMAYRAELIPQFLWSSLQAVEKYIKCILLLNRIKAKNLKHDLGAGLNLLDKEAPFHVRLRKPSREFITHLDTYGRFRYLETPFHVKGLEIMQLDMTVWDIRRYCQVLNHEKWLPNGEKKGMLDLELKAIEKSETRAPQLFHLIGGALEKIVTDKKHPARGPLIWQNLFFGRRPRKKVRLRRYMASTNSPLSLHPEILTDVLEYVFLPKDVISAYQKEILKKQ